MLLNPFLTKIIDVCPYGVNQGTFKFTLNNGAVLSSEIEDGHLKSRYICMRNGYDGQSNLIMFQWEYRLVEMWMERHFKDQLLETIWI
jgi:hypothetical protein